MSETGQATSVCPFCGGEVEKGCLSAKIVSLRFNGTRVRRAFGRISSRMENQSGRRPALRDTHNGRALSQMPEDSARLLIGRNMFIDGSRCALNRTGQ